MSAPTHNDPSKAWLIFFFVCFTLTVGMIGLWAALAYKVDDGAAPAPAGGHGHGMILPRPIPNLNHYSIV
jgi:hypothetical protein